MSSLNCVYIYKRDYSSSYLYGASYLLQLNELTHFTLRYSVVIADLQWCNKMLQIHLWSWNLSGFIFTYSKQTIQRGVACKFPHMLLVYMHHDQNNLPPVTGCYRSFSGAFVCLMERQNTCVFRIQVQRTVFNENAMCIDIHIYLVTFSRVCLVMKLQRWVCLFYYCEIIEVVSTSPLAGSILLCLLSGYLILNLYRVFRFVETNNDFNGIRFGYLGVD